jgi:hypothetical protein
MNEAPERASNSAVALDWRPAYRHGWALLAQEADRCPCEPRSPICDQYMENRNFAASKSAIFWGCAATGANLTVAESLEISSHRWQIVIPKPAQACFSINSTLYPSGSSTKAITVVPPFTGPASRETLPPASRMRLQAAAASSTSSAMWP